MKKKWIKLVDGKVVQAVVSIQDEVAEYLAALSKNPSSLSEEVLKDLKKRKLIEKK
jgi:hypothetical protein